MATKSAIVQAELEQETPYDTTDKETVNKARKKEARNRATRLKFVDAAMNHEEGRAWFYDILKRCHIFESSFNQDPYFTAFRCGEQNIGLMLLDDVQTISADRYNLMIQEAKTRNG